MRNILKCLLVVSMLLAMPLLAQAADKVGVVSADDVMANSDVGKRTMADFAAKVEAKQKELARQGDDLKRQDEEFRKKSVTMSSEARAKEQGALEVKFKKFMEDQNAAQQQMAREQQRLMEPLLKVFQQVVADYAKKNGFSLIVEKRMVYFAGGGVDVTAEVTKEFESAARRGAK
ncbi:hypothetical protein JCM15519_33630 [Fundidesulfovibrio butyratiphilus]